MDASLVRTKRDKEFTVSKMARADIAEIKEIERESGLECWSTEHYQGEILHKNSVCLVARDNKTASAVGFLVARAIKDKGENGSFAEIYNIAVCEDFRRRNLGTYMFSRFAKTLKKRQIDSVWLEVRESNFAARAFYESKGFEVAQVRKNFYANPRENALLMRLYLKR